MVVVVLRMVVVMAAAVVVAVATVGIMATVLLPVRRAGVRVAGVGVATLGRVVDSHQAHGTDPSGIIRMTVVRAGLAVVAAVLRSTIAAATVPTMGHGPGDPRHQEHHNNHCKHDEVRNGHRGRHGVVLRPLRLSPIAQDAARILTTNGAALGPTHFANGRSMRSGVVPTVNVAVACPSRVTEARIE